MHDHETAKHITDIGAAILSVFALTAHVTQIANPILVTVSTVLAITWTATRLFDRFSRRDIK